MLKNKTVAVVVPAYNEEKQIVGMLKTIPVFVDRIVVVNDKSIDETEEAVRNFMGGVGETTVKLNHKGQKVEPNKYNRADLLLKGILEDEKKLYTPSKIVNEKPNKSRIILINHLKNAGVGASIATGYRWCRDNKIDCTAVMAGDGQMDPAELESICMPVVEEGIDYVKGNRLKHRSALLVVPKIRFIGNSILTLLTKIASGYWRISDTQTGYTAISLKALQSIRIHKIYKSYGCPNDILVKLNISFNTIKEVETKPIYNIGEKSKMNELKVVPRISWLLLKSFWIRLYKKYLFRDFHPLFLLYHLGLILLLIDLPFIRQAFISIAPGKFMPVQNTIIFTFLTISALQSLFFAMWMDMLDNERLHK